MKRHSVGDSFGLSASETETRTSVAILCSSEDHPVNCWLVDWIDRHPSLDISVVRDAADLRGGDFLFLISCGEIVRLSARALYRHCLVLHASDLPTGRGWSPHLWDILEGGNELTVSLFTASDAVYSGPIWKQETIRLEGAETYNEINDLLFEAELRLMDWAIGNCDRSAPRLQQGAPSYHRRRTPADSEVRPEQTIAEIFDLLRVSDPTRFPAYFSYRGETYVIAFRKASTEQEGVAS